MKIKVHEWTIERLISEREFIREQPDYQRGKVWPRAKNQLLIDSVIRGFDMPKIYLRELEEDFFRFEVADGQQRINAIFEFYDNKFSLSSTSKYGLDLAHVDGVKIGGMKFKKLKTKHSELTDLFLDTTLTIAIVEEANDEEIRTLFGRLQLGTQLNTAEKRNAIISAIGKEIDFSAKNHLFFNGSEINKNRFTRQDFLAHALTLCLGENEHDLKSSLIDKLYYKHKDFCDIQIVSDTYTILKWMKEINDNSIYTLSNKWTFVDTFWFLYKKLKNGAESIDAKRFADIFDDFETNRQLYYSDPNSLVVKDKIEPDKVELFRYLTAFKTEGALINSIKVRGDFFEKKFSGCINFKK